MRIPQALFTARPGTSGCPGSARQPWSTPLHVIWRVGAGLERSVDVGETGGTTRRMDGFRRTRPPRRAKSTALRPPALLSRRHRLYENGALQERAITGGPGWRE